MSFKFPSSVQKVGEDFKQKSFYLGFEPSGTFHLGHYILLRKLKSLSTQSTCKILLADVHARLNKKQNIDQNLQKSKEFLRLYAPNIQIITGSDLIKSSDFWMNFLQFSNLLNLNDVRRGLPLDLKKNYNLEKDLLSTPFSMWLYPVLQAIDPHALNVEGVLAGKDQRNIYMLMHDKHYKKLDWSIPNCYFYPLLDLSGQIGSVEKKMSSSGQNIPLDGNLVRNLLNRIQNESNPCVIDFISNPQVLDLFEVSSTKELIQTTYEDLKSLENFYF
jgi:tyrosyl-tRNA synthetase